MHMLCISDFSLQPKIESNVTAPDTHDNVATIDAVLGIIEDNYTQTLQAIRRFLDQSQAIHCEEQERLRKVLMEAQEEREQLGRALMDAEKEVKTLSKELGDSKAELQSLKSLMSSVAQKLSQGTASD